VMRPLSCLSHARRAPRYKVTNRAYHSRHVQRASTPFPSRVCAAFLVNAQLTSMAQSALRMSELLNLVAIKPNNVTGPIFVFNHVSGPQVHG